MFCLDYSLQVDENIVDSFLAWVGVNGEIVVGYFHVNLIERRKGIRKRDQNEDELVQIFCIVDVLVY